MVAAVHDMEKIFRGHFAPDFLQEVERTECVAGSLDKQDGCPQFAQNLVAQLRWIAATAERVAEADKPRHGLFKRHMAANPAAHTFSNKDYASIALLLRALQCFAVSCDKRRQRIGPPSTFLHVGVIKRFHLADPAQALLPSLHPRMGRWRAGAGRE